MVRVAILGMDLIGGSLGMALLQARLQGEGGGKGETIQVVGYDEESRVLREAHVRGAASQVTDDLEEAVHDANLVVISTPARAVAETLQAIAPLVPADCVVTDTAGSKVEVLRWAREFLPDEVGFVGGHPIFAPEQEVDWAAGVKGATAALFKDALYCLVPSPHASERAVNTVTGMVNLVGAQSYFLDPGEHDGLLAGVSHVPHLLAAVMIRTMASSPSWRELKLLADPSFRHLSWLLSRRPADIQQDCLSNRQPVVSWLDRVIAALQEVRQEVAREGSMGETILDLLEEAGAARRDWIKRRDEREGEAGSDVMPQVETAGQQIAHMFVPRFFRRRKSEEEE